MENYFLDALHNFIFEEAGGGAIRHLANRGYTARQIADSLSFPVPYEKVREALTKYLLESGILLRERPETGIKREKAEYVREYDRYGKPSFRKVTVSADESRTGRPDAEEKWEEMDFERFLLLYESGAKKLELAAETELAEAERNIYISCAFGADQAGELLRALTTAQQEYIQGICFTRKPMYHLLDKRIYNIAVRMYERKLPVGKVYFRH